jgi:hypothetical protein
MKYTTRQILLSKSYSSIISSRAPLEKVQVIVAQVIVVIWEDIHELLDLVDSVSSPYTVYCANSNLALCSGCTADYELALSP